MGRYVNGGDSGRTQGASRTTGTIFESKRKNGPFRITGDEPDDGQRETADSGRSKLRNQRRIEFFADHRPASSDKVSRMIRRLWYVGNLT